jgi:hypothetical protein
MVSDVLFRAFKAALRAISFIDDTYFTPIGQMILQISYIVAIIPY